MNSLLERTPTHITISLFRGWLVVAAAVAMGIVFGILYSWSVVKAGIPASWGWSNADKALPYSVMCVMFALVMVPAGRLQDRFGPRWVVLLGGVLAGLGCVIAGVGGGSKLAYVVGFGVFTGIGVGFGYSALTPAAMKWFPPRNTGLVVGIVVAGSGLAPVFLAPLTTWLLNRFAVTAATGVVEQGVSQAMISLGVLIWLVVGTLFWFIENPPLGFAAVPGTHDRRMSSQQETGWQRMVRTPQFWLMYLMYFVGASAGLTFISVAADLGRQALGELAFLAVVVLALGNTVGRVIAGAVSDRIGRHLTLFAEFLFQGGMIGALFWASKQATGNGLVILAVLFCVGLNYGANLAIFPAACKDQFGIRYFGLNYGCLFTAFGLAGLVMPLLNGFIRDVTGNQDMSYILIMAMLAVAALMSLVSRQLAAGERG
ncbi:L-lactate MFS transporter [Geomobilimonas luticola]|uniref:OFA family MFS transporter n=1 Tax=Geomobilimonas luticola TaxID=1114878 RepID=A0ABS5SBN8_9BACT|nr:OFA family MFS transporter [Geomobilimonas luticola]MBT0651447.1 OFA family MFS transporter [Geomobilimonas luticola]